MPRKGDQQDRKDKGVQMIRIANPGMAIDREILEAAENVLKSGNYIMGERTRDFEKSLSAFLGCSNSVAVSSGTAALHLALLACGIGPGDEVITTPHTFMATASTISHTGARPVLVDIDEETHNIDPSGIEAAITERTKAIVPVHIYGHPADMNPIMEVAQKRGLKVIEDACQAIGAEYRGEKAATIGDAGCFSFFPSKVMTVCGDGGAVCTKDEGIADRIRMLRNQGREAGKKYEHDAIGFNYRMSEILAAIGGIELKRLPSWMDRRTEIARKYDSLLGGIDGVTIPAPKAWARPSYYVYTIRVPAEKRESLSSFLNDSGIQTGIYYPITINMQPAYRAMNMGRFPVAERITKEILSLPMHQFLKDTEVETVSAKVREFFDRQ